MLGLVLVLAGAYLYPLPANPRVRSDIESVPNGGRKEDFYVNLDLDRLAPAQEVRVAPFPEPALMPDGNQVIRAEVFKLRNDRRQVIGLATRMTGLVPDADGEASVAVQWLILLPSRGAFLLSQGSSIMSGLLPESAGIEQGRMLVGDGEFGSLSGSYVEATLLEDTDGDGVDEAVVRLSTRLAAEDAA